MNDARNKLRSMGGIMASSPELMQAAMQGYQAGGIAMTTAPMGPPLPATQYNDFARPQMEPPIVGLGRVAPLPVRPAGLPDRLPAELASFSMQDWRKMSRKERKAAGLPVSELGAQLFFDQFGVGLGLVEPDARYTAEGPVETEAERLMAGSSANQPVDSIDDLRAARGFGLSAYLSGLEGNVVNIPEPVRPAGMDEGPITPTFEAEVPYDKIFGDIMGENEPRRSNVVSRDVEALEGPEATGLGGQQIPLEEELAPVLAPVTGMPEEEKARVTERAVSALRGSAQREQQPQGRAKASQKSDLRSAFNENLKLFQEVFGTQDADIAKDRAMSLAMIGLAIASGTSPDALTNIARGAMAGVQFFSEAGARRRQREQEIKVLALETAIEEQRAEEQFKRDAALADQEFVREFQLEMMKLGNVEQYRDVPVTRTLGGFGAVSVYLPTPTAAKQGVAPVLADPADMDKMYEQSISGRQRVFGMVDKARNLIETADIGGVEGAFARAKQDLSALTPDAIERIFGTTDPTLPATPQQQYDTLMRAMAAQYTPIILGESGRTISDGDRQRVAEILGFAVDPASGRIGRYVGTAVTSESELRSALDEVERILVANYSDMDKVYARYRPEQYAQFMKQQEEAAAPKRMIYDPETDTFTEKES